MGKKCRYSPSCSPGSTEIAVCKSGCNYSTIQGAIDDSSAGDKIFIIDGGVYEENVVVDSTTASWIDCQAGANISGVSGDGFYFNETDDFVIVNCNIDHFTNGIHLLSSSGLIKNITLRDNGV